MTKTQPQLPLDQSAQPRRLAQVVRMEDLVEGQSVKGFKPKGFVNRFWLLTKVGSPEKCWEWRGVKDNKGYGRLKIGTKGCGKRNWLAHRISFLIARGEIRKDLLICHHCDNPSCVNPGHLFCGTQKDNLQDASRKGRMCGPRKRLAAQWLDMYDEKDQRP